MWSFELSTDHDADGYIALARSTFHPRPRELGEPRTLYVSNNPSEEKCTQMLEFIRANPTPPVQFFNQYDMTGVVSPTMTALFDIINPTLEFSSQDFRCVTDTAVPIKSLASATVASYVYRMSRRGHIEALIAAVPSFKVAEIWFGNCDFTGHTKPLFRALVCSSITKVCFGPLSSQLDGRDPARLAYQHQVRVSMFALLHARKRSHGKMNKLPLEMYRLVGQMLMA